MLGWRLFLSALLVPALVAIFVLDARSGETAPLLFLLCLALVIRGTWELVRLLKTRNIDPSFSLSALCALAVLGAGWSERLDRIAPEVGSAADANAASLAAIGLTYSLTVLVLMLGAAIRYREPGRSMEMLGAEVLVVSYVGVLLAVTAQLRWVAGAEAGYLVLGSMVIAAKCGDIGAYTLGRLFGKRKMIPRLSPGKTWMGALGAVIGSGLGAWAWLHFGTPMFDSAWRPPAALPAIAYGVMIGIVGLVGDLCESLIKRDVGQKDSAHLLPGFGGLLDLLDSVLYAGPVAYVLWQVLPLATWR